MLSEEKQAIDILQNQIADYVIGNYCTFCGDFIICENKDKDCYYVQAIDTVLNLITKLQKENEHWKNGFEKESEENRKNTCELLKQDLIIREKDKQIDLMIEYWHCGLAICDDCKIKDYDENKCKLCVRQYFEKLAKEKDI